MALKLDSHFVAFIDILGFSEMVRTDCESPDAPKHLEILYNAHVRAANLFAQDLDAGLIQFSDSIVFSKPFNIKALAGFLNAISAWQQALLLDGLLCRGGVAFGKHFVKDKFLFSKAMIDAYILESGKARFPRIVISEDLLQLAGASIQLKSLPIRREDDGAVFIDFLKYESENEKTRLSAAVASISDRASGASSSVQEKIRWINRYADHALGTSVSIPQFVDVND